MPPSILAIWALSGLLGAAGLLLVLAACFLSAHRLGSGAPLLGSRGGRCGCCGYSTDGLEEDLCPECGKGFASAAARRERRRRSALATAGLAGLALGGMGMPAANAARFGVAHALPNIALIETVGWRPAAHREIAQELQMRADSGALRCWERRELARVCTRALGAEPDISARRSVAWVLSRIAPEVGAPAIDAMLGDPDPGVRAEGANTAGRLGRGWADDNLRGKLAAMACLDRSALVRKRALDAIRTMGAGPETSAALNIALLDPNQGVRQRAVIALAFGPMDDDAAVAAATSATCDSDENVRWTAAWVLSQIALRQKVS